MNANAPQIWTPRDHEILRALTRQLRLMSLEQIARTWWQPSKHRAQYAQLRMQRLAQAGLVARYRLPAHVLPSPATPVFTWRPGLPPPDYGQLSHQLRSRWSASPQPTLCYAATPLAANLYAAVSAKLRPLDTTHDLMLSEAFRWYRQHRPELLPLWWGEDALGKAGFQIKDPDALLLREGQPFHAIESGGSYDAQRVEAFHEHCLQYHGIPPFLPPSIRNK